MKKSLLVGTSLIALLGASGCQTTSTNISSAEEAPPGVSKAIYEHKVEQVKEQVENIPDMLINLVVPVGSGIQMAGILRGLTKYEKYVENIYGLCIGPDRRTRIDYFVNPLEYPIPSYNMIELKTKYANLAREFYGGGRLDELYEAKAYRWMVDNLNIENEKTLFWIVGRRLFEDEVLENYDLT